MSSFRKSLLKILQGNADANVRFSELCQCLDRFGFTMRIKGSHHIFYREDIEEILNLQPSGGNAKPYQVKQVRNVIIKYRLAGKI